MNTLYEIAIVALCVGSIVLFERSKYQQLQIDEFRERLRNIELRSLDNDDDGDAWKKCDS